MMHSVKVFLRCDNGAVSVEWAIFAAFGFAMGIALVSATQSSLSISHANQKSSLWSDHSNIDPPE